VDKSFLWVSIIIQTTSAVFFSLLGTRENTEYKFYMSEQSTITRRVLANFNWHNFEEGIDPVNQEKKKFEELVTKHLFLLIKKK
jgi:hypothetical protein